MNKSPMLMRPHEHRQEAKRLLTEAAKLHQSAEEMEWDPEAIARAQQGVANTIALGQLHATLSQDWDVR